MQPVLYEIMKKAYTGIYIENKIKLVIYFNNTPPLYKTFENSFVVKLIFFLITCIMSSHCTSHSL